MNAPPWDDLKVCFSIDSGVERLWRANERGAIAWPTGWELNETDISGAAGYVAIFRVTVLPTAADGFKVKALLRNWARDRRK